METLSVRPVRSQRSAPVAACPLAIFYKGAAYYYGWDLTKNITEIFSLSARLQVDYVYTPFGHVRGDGIIPQPIQWSSEMYDAELGLVYCNYRYYNPLDGRWTRRDPLFRLNRYRHTGIDYLGLDNTYGLSKEFWDWFHRCEKDKYVKSLPREKKIRGKNCPKDVYDPRNPDVPKEDALKFHDKWKDLEEPRNCRKKDDQKRDPDPRVKQVYRRSEEGSKYSDYSTWEITGEVIKGLALTAAGVTLATATIVEDVGTGGAGVADDIPTLTIAGSWIYRGIALISAAL